MAEGRGFQWSSPRAGMASSQYGHNVGQELWSDFSNDVATSSVPLDYDEQALRSLHHPRHHQNARADSGMYPGLAHTMTMPLESSTFWQHEDMARIKNEEPSEEVHHTRENYADACEQHDRDRVPRRSRGSSSTSVPARPHAAVEKRYRRTVNTKLQQLHAAIPSSGSFSLESSERGRSSADDSEPEQAAKPVVLDKAIQYTTHLIETYRKYDEDIVVLRQQVREWLGEDGIASSTIDGTEGVE